MQGEREDVTYLSDTELANYLGEQPTRLSAEHAPRIVEVVVDAFGTSVPVESR
jgi:hypothetical protein